MNDDFLHRMRAQPPSRFATRLKAKLDQQTKAVSRKAYPKLYIAIALAFAGMALSFMLPIGRHQDSATLSFKVSDTAGKKNIYMQPPPRSTEKSVKTPLSAPVIPKQQQTNSAPALQMTPRYWRVQINSRNDPVQSSYEFMSDQAVVWEGSASGALIARDKNIPIDRRGVVVQVIAATPFQGKRIKYSAHLKTGHALPGYSAGLWLRMQDRNGAVVGSLPVVGVQPLMSSRLLAAYEEWSELSIVTDVPANASVILYGAFESGGGTLWIDDAHILTVDESVPLTGRPYRDRSFDLGIDPSRVLQAPANLDFEDSVPADEDVYWNVREQPTFSTR